MSIKVMSKLWESGPKNKTQLLVLLALADFANDEGHCWPSMATIAKKARLTDRGARKVVRQLEADGWLEVRIGAGRHHCNVYTVKTEPKSGNEKPRTGFRVTCPPKTGPFKIRVCSCNVQSNEENKNAQVTFH